MKKILLSMMTIMSVVVLAAGATYGVFSSSAKVQNNTYSTGVLEIRADGSPAITGMSVTNAAPGTVGTKVFTLQNFGQPWFNGPSTLAAKEISSDANKTGGDYSLYRALKIKLYANAGWNGCSKPGTPFVSGKGCLVYDGWLHELNGGTMSDVLHATQWGYASPTNHAELAPGNSLTITADVWLPEWAGNEYMGKSTAFELVFTGYNPHR